MSAIFDFSSLITVLLLAICTTAYLRELRPTIFDTDKQQNVRASDDCAAAARFFNAWQGYFGVSKRGAGAASVVSGWSFL
jgi:Protein of unknown function (DUF1242)